MKRLASALIVMLAPAAAQAASLCDTVAAELKEIAARRPGELVRLDDMPRVAAPGPELQPFEGGSEAAQQAQLKRRFNAFGPQFEDVFDGSTVNVTRVGQTGPIALWDIQGTLHCSFYRFLLPHEGAPAGFVTEPTRPPTGATREGLCWTSNGWLGDIGGKPVFAAEDRDLFTPAQLIEIVPWEGRGWGKACAVEAKYEPTFKISSEAYRNAEWGELQVMAPDIAAMRHVNDHDTTFSYGPAADEAKFQAMKRLAPESPVDLPRFGGEYETYDTFDPEAPYFPLVVGERTYLARIGHGNFGWRVSPDYLLAVWDLIDGKLEPMAGIVISTNPGELTSLRVSYAVPLTPAD